MSDRRIGELATLQAEIGAWSTRINEKQRAVDWQFTIDKARVKLKRLYPKIKYGPDTSMKPGLSCDSLAFCSLTVSHGEPSDPQRNSAANGFTQTAERFVSRLLAFLAYL